MVLTMNTMEGILMNIQSIEYRSTGIYRVLIYDIAQSAELVKISSLLQAFT